MKQLTLPLLLLITQSALFGTETKFISDRGFGNIWLWQLSNTSMAHEKGITLSKESTQNYKTPHLLWGISKIGDSFYLGTADSAKIIKLSEDFKEEIIYQNPDKSLIGAIEKDGNGIIAGISPDSELIHLDDNNKVTHSTELSNTYIWDIVPNPKGGFSVLTGLPAELYEYNNQKLSTAVKNDNEEHLLKGIYVGDTLWVLGENALYRKQGNRFIALASFKNTASSFIYHKNIFYIIHSSTPKNVDPAKKEQISSFLTAVKLDGSTEELLRLQGFYFTSVGVHDQSIVIGADQFGLYVLYDLISKKNSFSSLGMGKILEIIDNKGKIQLMTSDPSTIWTIGNNISSEGSFVSEIYDTGNIASWGALSVKTSTPPKTGVNFFMQSGATSNPDYWNDWKPIKPGEKINAPSSHFIRYKAVLNSDGKALPYVCEVKFPYTEINLAPMINSLDFAQENQEIKITWNASDPNKDALEYDIYLAEDGMPNVKINETPFTGTNFSFSNYDYPSGSKRITLTASDRPSNSDKTALTASYKSIPILFDSDNPIIGDININQMQRKAEISVTIEDKTSFIKKFIYIINGQQEKFVLPEDGIFDNKIENFKFSIPIDNTTFLQIQTIDEANNMSSKGIMILKK